MRAAPQLIRVEPWLVSVNHAVAVGADKDEVAELGLDFTGCVKR
jgi:hypothetical protein